MGFNYLDIACEGVKNLRPYEPGKSTEDIERELGLTGVVKLASNESPLGPSPKAADACREMANGTHLYPDNDSHTLKAELSRKHAIPETSLVIGNGSTQLIELIANVFLDKDSEAIYSEYAFIYYAISVTARGAKGVMTPAKDWGHDLEAMAAAITDKTKVIFLANPNNPTGTWFEQSHLNDFMQKVPEQVLVVLDEAYIDYQAAENLPDSIVLRNQYENLIITRTFSKAYGLGGLRLGYAIAPEQIANILNRYRAPFSINALAEKAAVASLHDSEHLQTSCQVNQEGMQQITQGLKNLAVDYIPSAGNFVTIRSPMDCQQAYSELLMQGVIVRPLTPYGMSHHLRCTIGTTEQNEKLLHAIKKVFQ